MPKKTFNEIQKKAKERTVKTQNIEYDLETLVKKIKKGVIKLNPEYQRKHRWSEGFSSRLIESLILNIPIPTIYISQDVDVDVEVLDDIPRYSVIDGQQRLTAIFNFFENKYKLVDVDILTELNGLKYKDLPPFLIRRLEERSIKCLRIDSTVDAQVKYDIFERLNSGSVKLEAQELRNATCRGPFKTLIKKLAKEEIFTSLCKLKPDSARVKKMEDEELVLRFFALAYEDGYIQYKNKFKNFLTEKMKNFNAMSIDELNLLEKSFFEVFKLIRKQLGDNPFQKFKEKEDKLIRMSSFNAAVFDAIIVTFWNIKIKRDIRYIDFKNLFKDKDFFSSVEGSVNDAAKIKKRVNLTKAFFKK